MEKKHIRPPLHPTKSAADMLAQTPGLSPLRTKLPAGMTDYIANLSTFSGLSVVDKAVIELLYLYGLRISEVLAIRSNDIQGTGLIRVPGTKGSRTRYVMPVNFLPFWLSHYRPMLPLSRDYTRFYFYRLFKKIGFYSLAPGRQNFSVTHHFRRQVLVSLKAEGYTNDELTAFIGHRSKKSISYYV